MSDQNIKEKPGAVAFWTFSALALISAGLYSAKASSWFDIINPNTGDLQNTSPQNFIKSAKPEDILKFIYGNYNSATETASWVLQAADASNLQNVPALEPDAQKFAAGQNFSISIYTAELKGSNLIVLTAATPQSMLSSSTALLGGFIFAKSGSVWRLITAQKVFEQISLSDLAASNAKLIKLGANVYAFELIRSTLRQGVAHTAISMDMAAAGKFRRVFEYADAAENNSAAKNQAYFYAYSTQLNLIPAGSANYYNIKVTKGGTRPSQAGAVASESFSENAVFHFEKDHYISQ
jgi:hypothetical protein